MSGLWSTSVSEIVLIFRDALEKLIPELERSRIPTRSVPGTDAWDEISETLYRYMVVEAIRAALPEREMENFRLPQYETMYEDYRELSFIEALPNQPSCEGRLVFHSFLIEACDVSTILCRTVNERGAVTDDQMRELNVASVRFRVQQRLPRTTRELDELRIVL